MLYRAMGNTGLLSSVLSFGFWATFGVKDSLNDDKGIAQAQEILKYARTRGVNLFDHAEAYGNPNGEAERIFGVAYKNLLKEDPDLWRRSSIIITTKIFWGGPDRNERGLSRKHVFEGLEASLKRLQLDYVDMVFCHRPDNLTSTESVVRTFTDVVRSGKAMSWGTSEWSAQQQTEAYYIAMSQGLEPPRFEQPQYNMFCRERFEKEYFPMFKAPYNMGTTIWSPLASGLLTGKYNKDIPEGSRLTQPGYEWLIAKLDTWKKDGTLEKVGKLDEYAKANFDATVTQLALAWCVKNPNVTTVLLGATKVSQIEDNLKALELVDKLTPEHLEKIEEILDNKPLSWHGAFERKLE